MVEMVLNELSVAHPATDIRGAREWMAGFIDTLSAAIRRGVRPVLRAEEELHGIMLAPDYPVSRWRNDSAVDVEARRLLRSLTSKVPCVNAVDDLPEFRDQWQGCDFAYDGEVVVGLGFAFAARALAVSVPSHARWDTDYLWLAMSELDGNGELVDNEVRVPHASSAAHVNSHAGWITATVRSVASGAELLARRDELLPSVDFCASAIPSLRQINAGFPQLAAVLDRLFELQDYCTGWSSGPFIPAKLGSKATPESAATLGQYSAERTFVCPDGVSRLFDWHVRVSPGAWRIHFYPDEPNRRFLVGYIGPHLPTVRDPT